MPFNNRHIKTAAGLVALLITTAGQAQTYTVSSPDGRNNITLTSKDDLTISVTHAQQPLLEPSAIDLTTDPAAPAGWKISSFKKTHVDALLHPVVAQKQATIHDLYNEGTIRFRNNLTLLLRAYNNGVAWRWIINGKGAYNVNDEKVTFAFHSADSVLYPLEETFYSHNERLYKPGILQHITPQQLGSLPVLVTVGQTRVLVTESDLYDYAGLWLTGDGKGTLNGTFPRHPKELKETSDRDRKVITRDPFIATGVGTKNLPWRTLVIADNDGELLTNTLVYQLSTTTTDNYSWVKPGKVSWDWWNDNNVYNVDFRAGVNTDTYKYYIDFAAHYGLPYVILDEGWSRTTTDLMTGTPVLNMDELSTYARQKNVGLILWTTWLALDKNLDDALDQFVKWDVKGIKVDFMQRDDQLMVNYYEKIAIAAAKRHLLVDFHGAYKPTGMERKYPNVLSREGVYGLENSKWDTNKRNDPEHNVTLPFTRNAVGPMDYTPGAMLNAQKDAYRVVPTNPMSLGTRCQQLAMYVIYESPLQMLADNPTHYYKEPECMEFLKDVPVEWDTTIALQAQTGDYIALARKAKNGNWYIGAMTDWTPRDLQLNLSFLPTGNYTLDSWQDGINADRNAQDFKRTTKPLNGAKTITVHLAPGGGFVGVIKP